MAYSIKSKEFADAWRIVSESLLQHIQGMEYPSTDVISNIEAAIQNVQPTNQDSVKSPNAINPLLTQNHGEAEERYAMRPVRKGENGYIFKTLKSKEDKQDGSIFKIMRYPDGYCEFEICELNKDEMQILLDSKENLLPETVGSLEGEIDVNSKIITVEKGIGKTNGRSVEIIKPLKAVVK